MFGGRGEGIDEFTAVETVPGDQLVEVCVIAVPGVEISESDGGGQLLCDDGRDRVAVEREGRSYQGLRVINSGPGVTGSPKLTSSWSLSRARLRLAAMVRRSPWYSSS